MPLYLDKILSQLAYPLGTAISLVLLALMLLLVRRRGLAVTFIILALTWLGALSMPAVSDRLRLSLESRYDHLPAEAMPKADVIVLLGGGMYPTPPEWPHAGMGASADRVWHAARLYHAGKAPWIIASGGSMGWSGERRSGAESMRELLLAFGVPDSAILLEERSRNTHDNAVFSAEIMHERGLETALLVTSALHMHRSAAVFRAAGLPFTAAATDFEIAPEPAHILRWLPDAQALADSTRALKEYLGLVVYRIRGWAD